MKIVINSNVNYNTAIKFFFESLVGSGFDRFEDVVLVVSESAADAPPVRAPLSRFVPGLGQAEITFIGAAINNFDYAGFDSLRLHIDHPLVSDDSYLYLLDTVTFEGDFPERYSGLSACADCVYTCIHPHSNICVFGRDVVKNYGDNFSFPMTKWEAISLEFNRTIEKDGRVIKGITEFGSFVRARDRVDMGPHDIYGTSHPRIRFHYPDFGVSKWILWGHNGDMKGRVEPNLG